MQNCGKNFFTIIDLHIKILLMHGKVYIIMAFVNVMHYYRLGVPATGDRIPGHLPVPCALREPTPERHPHPLGRRVGLPLAALQDHAGSCA